MALLWTAIQPSKRRMSFILNLIILVEQLIVMFIGSADLSSFCEKQPLHQQSLRITTDHFGDLPSLYPIKSEVEFCPNLERLGQQLQKKCGKDQGSSSD